MVEGVLLMRILCFVLCVFCFAEPTMESDRWPVSRGGERNGPMAAEIESVTGVERSDGRDFQQRFIYPYNILILLHILYRAEDKKVYSSKIYDI
jgi:hypothetical protein